MANPNPAYAGTISYFAITNSTNLDTDLSQYITSIEPTYEKQRIDTTTMGNTSRQFIQGFQENGYRLEGVWDATLDSVMFTVLAKSTAAPIRYGPAGTASGLPQHNGTATFLSYRPPSNVNDAVRWTAEVAVNGAVTRSTF